MTLNPPCLCCCFAGKKRREIEVGFKNTILGGTSAPSNTQPAAGSKSAAPVAAADAVQSDGPEAAGVSRGNDEDDGPVDVDAAGDCVMSDGAAATGAAAVDNAVGTSDVEMEGEAV